MAHIPTIGKNMTRRKSSDIEHHLQAACVQWFRLQYPKLKHNLFAIPNGGRRDQVTGARLKLEGVLPGVADLILLKPNKQFHALLIEMKTRLGRQSEAQRQWQRLIEADGYRYVICRTTADFIRTVNEYLNA